MITLDFLNNEYSEEMPRSREIEQSIVIDILTGALRPGSRLIEARLCEKYEISRSPLREIINRISSSGLVELIPNRGAFVKPLSDRDIDDYFYLKSAIYPQAVKWAIERITEEELAMLEETFAFMEFYTATEDIDKMIRINDGFERIIYNATHNTALEAQLKRYDFILKYTNYDVSYPMNYLPQVLEEHRGIFEAFRDGNPEAGYDAAQIHAFNTMLRRR